MSAYATIEDLELVSTWCDMKELSEEELEHLLERGARWIRRYTNKTFADETNPDTLADLKWANCLLAEYLYYFDDPELKQNKMLAVEQERIGNYSYVIRDSVSDGVKVGELTGNEELDSILMSLKDDITGFNYFGINGPSSRRKWRRL